VAVVAIVGAYTAALIVLLAGGDDGGGATKVRTVVVNGKPVRLTPLEARVRGLVRNAKLFQQEGTDVQAFRKPRVYSIRCKEGDCRVAYAVAVPGRGRINFQQLEMVRAVFGHTSVQRLSVRVTRSLPTGPSASPPAEEETAAGLPLNETTCDRSEFPRRLNWDSQKEAQGLLSRNCTVRNYQQGVLHGNAKSPKGRSAPNDDSAGQGAGSGAP
jgi:hypothetical protein